MTDFKIDDRVFNARQRTLYSCVGLSIGLFALGIGIIHMVELRHMGIITILTGSWVAVSANYRFVGTTKGLKTNDLPPGYKRGMIDLVGFLVGLLGILLTGSLL